MMRDTNVAMLPTVYTGGIYKFQDFVSTRPQPRVSQMFPPH